MRGGGKAMQPPEVHSVLKCPPRAKDVQPRPAFMRPFQGKDCDSLVALSSQQPPDLALSALNLQM